MAKVPKKLIKTKSDQAAIEAGCYFDQTAADRVVEFFERFLCHSKGEFAGQPFRLLPWQKDELIYPLFGWKNSDGTRRFRLGYAELPKKNGKSSLASGISIYLAIADNEPGAEVYNAASDREQAGIVFNEAKNMIVGSSGLSQYARVIDSKKRIEFAKSNSFIRAISSEAYTAEGLNIHGLIFDELHAQKTRELWDALRYGGAARRQPLLLSITTAGWDTTTICYEQHEYAAKVLSGEIVDPAFFALIYAADKNDDPKKKSTWKKANPSLGVTINERDFEQAAREACESPVKMNAFLRYRLNVWTEQADRWLSWDAWCACSKVKDPIAWREKTIEDLKDAEVYAGLDLGATSDLTALVFLHPARGIVLPWFWAPEACVSDRRNPNRDLYRTWAEQKFLTLTPGNVTDYDRIRADVAKFAERFFVKEIAVDRLFQGAQLSTQLMEDGHEVVSFGQGFLSMAAPTKEFERRVIAGKLEHGNNPILSWMAGNVSVATDPAGNMKPQKPGGRNQYKIDGIVAAIMALGRAIQNPQEEEIDGELFFI